MFNGYRPGTLGSLAFGGAQSNNLAGGGTTNPGVDVRRSGPTGNRRPPRGEPYPIGQTPPRPGIDYDPRGSAPTWDDYWGDFRRRAGW